MKATEYRRAAAKAMSEDELQSNVVQRAETFQWLWWHDTDSRRNNAGLLDLILLRPPRLIFAELKTERGRLRDAQKVWFNALWQVPVVEQYLWRPSDLLSGDIERILR